MTRHNLSVAVSMVGAMLLAAPAFADVSPGTYYPTGDSFNGANAPGSSHLASGQPSCTVNSDLSIDCSAYVLGGVGHTNAQVELTADYTEIIDCRNHGGQIVETHTFDFSDSTSATLTSSRNGQLRVPSESAGFNKLPTNRCPNPNWTPEPREGSLQLLDFTYTLTFAGFSEPYITITSN